MDISGIRASFVVLEIKAYNDPLIVICLCFLQAESEGGPGGPSGGAGSGPDEDQDNGGRVGKRPGSARRGESDKGEFVQDGVFILFEPK